MVRRFCFCVMLGLNVGTGWLPILPESARAETSPVLVVSLPAQAFFVQELAPEATNIQVMFRPGVSHETFEPSMAQLRALSEARVYFKLGHPRFSFESKWLNKFLKENTSAEVVDCAAGIPLRDDDIHLWLSPKRMRTMVENIAVGLKHVYPSDEAAIERKKKVMLETIATVENEIATSLQAFHGRAFLVYHPAWGYFAEDFGLQQISVEHDGKEPGLAGVRKLLIEAKALQIYDIFIEPTSSRETAQVIAEELGGEVVVMDPLAENWPANLRLMAKALRASFLRSPKRGTPQ